jgi:hypothetical protein
MFVPDEPFSYSCIPLSLSFVGSSLRTRRLRRWSSAGSWVSAPFSVIQGRRSEKQATQYATFEDCPIILTRANVLCGTEVVTNVS